MVMVLLICTYHSQSFSELLLLHLPGEVFIIPCPILLLHQLYPLRRNNMCRQDAVIVQALEVLDEASEAGVEEDVFEVFSVAWNL